MAILRRTRELFPVYRKSFQLSVMQMSQYRMNLAFWIISLIAEPITYMAVWTVVATQQGGDVGGLTVGEFSAYYITWMLVRHFAVTLSPDALEWRVREGAFSGLMLRPVHPVHADIGDNLGYKLVALPISLLMMLGLAIAFPPTFNFQWWTALAFIPTMILAFLIRFLSHWILGLLAFWTTRARALYEMFFVAEIFLTGRLAPMSLLPGWVVTLASVLPFRWMISFPVEVFSGQLQPNEILIGLGIQVIWLLLMIGLLRGVWWLAMRQYTAVGA
jgi:ABC-2 type transport system permease protein